MRKPRKKEPVTLNAIHANRGVEAWYRSQLEAIVREVAGSMGREIKKQLGLYPTTGGLASDGNPVVGLRRTVDRWSKDWLTRINKVSVELATKFAAKNQKTTEAAFMGSLETAGFAVKFTPTPASMEAYQAVIGENVNLIRNLTRETLDDIQGAVWASVREGHDMGTLSTVLHEKMGMNMRRAELISRDQNNKAKAVIESTRRKEVGVREAIWQHSGGGIKPRESHVKAGRDKVRFNIEDGWYDPTEKKRIWPGVLINCRCVSKAIIPALDDGK